MHIVQKPARTRLEKYLQQKNHSKLKLNMRLSGKIHQNNPQNHQSHLTSKDDSAQKPPHNIELTKAQQCNIFRQLHNGTVSYC